MLIKLLKQDFKATGRQFAPALVVFFIIFALNKMMMELNFSIVTNSNTLDILFMISMSLYIIAIIGLGVMTQVFIITHFYRTMAGEQGYLTHTLPVRTSSLVNSKLIISFFWNMITMLIILLSFWGMSAGHIDLRPVAWFLRVFFRIFRQLEIIIAQIIAQVTIYVFVLTFISPLTYFFCIAVGNMMNRHKILGAVTTYIGIYTLLQFTSIFAIIRTQFFHLLDYQTYDSFLSGINLFFLASLGAALVKGAVFYLGTVLIFRKKLNLE